MKRHINLDTNFDLEGPIDDVIVRLQNIQEKYKDHAGVRIEADYGYEGSFTLDLQRLETDEEYERRLDRESNREREREKLERIQYEILKAKFEK